ncbi:MAG: MBL fold metallo-hydrolase [Bacteroidales bacterium]|nr:MBL fold metallo-hydrolase [Bacteroidales bacterium]
MITVEKLVFNPFQENTYIVYDETKECIVVDPGCYDSYEEGQLHRFISSFDLKPVCLINTHCHIDHILGNNFIVNKYDLQQCIHKAGLNFLRDAHNHAKIYGIHPDPVNGPVRFLEDGDLVEFGQSSLQVLYTPGHADGSVCLLSKNDRFVITGDVLFRDSIGRTDFPTGDFDLLMQSIHDKLFVLDDDFTVYPGHGPETSIGYEKVNNPFIRI